ncbi:MAG: alginate lyase family protein [Bacteroidota bacterium]
MNKLKQFVQIIQNMGLRYVSFRLGFEVMKKLGLLKYKYPTNPAPKQFISLADWKQLNQKFFFESKETLTFTKDRNNQLQEEALKILDGTLKFFSAQEYHLGKDYDWLTNPDTGFKYSNTIHWLYINDYSKQAGDIKYVWEKSRFTYLNTIIRYDYHFDTDQSEFVFSEIESWIKANPVNQGPNYKCSQETSLRVFNWLFALHYYKNSAALTEARFQSIMHAIYWQAKHINNNINFSRIAVRNNHAITETLGMYLIGLLMPYFPEAKQWKTKGKQFLEQEIAYQIYEDGTFLQFSSNYHRVVIQLLSWAIQLNKLNDTPFSDTFYQRAKASVHFLTTCMQKENGQLPNYGANDGALFFKFSNQHYRDYRPQLEALSLLLNLNWPYDTFEDKNWYGINNKVIAQKQARQQLSQFKKGGYYIINEANTLSFIRCGNHKDRPSQADNLHLDIWVDGENILRDAGSYKYNTSEEEIRYFFGTASHNTVMLNGFDQMRKGSRFIWFNWSQAVAATLNETTEAFEFDGTIKAFEYIEKGITHQRKVRKFKNELKWEVEDILKHHTEYPIKQIWNPSESFFNNYSIKAYDSNNQPIEPIYQDGFYSGLYGIKEPSKQIIFTSNGTKITTVIHKI